MRPLYGPMGPHVPVSYCPRVGVGACRLSWPVGVSGRGLPRLLGTVRAGVPFDRIANALELC
jgi:hypothetical protein